MYTILINNDNTAVATITQAIIQHTKLVDTLQFIVPKKYNEFDMSTFSFLLEYQTPISHKVFIETLDLINPSYKEDYLLYSMPVDTAMTTENGDVVMNLYFIKSSLDEKGKEIEQVRKISPISITIIPVSSFFTIPDPALETLTQYYIANQQQINALSAVAEILNKTKLDDITYNPETNRVMGKSNGSQVGTGVDVNELAAAVVESAGNAEGNIKIQKI